MEEKENKMETKKVSKTEKKDVKNKGNKKPFKKSPVKTLDEVVLDTKAVVKVTKGGRQRRFQAVVLVGDKKGLVGLGTGKANEVSEAVKKARQEATKNAVRIAIVDGRTIPHEVVCKQGATTVIIKPASAGTGLVAGGAVRSVLDIAGVKDVMSKSLGSRKKINVARATISALQSVKTIEQVCAERGKTKEEILG
ncbi:MAG: 30S ribosomal protein S5 [bacterium]|nr:30S ribosomal protein S5 [bacterium]